MRRETRTITMLLAAAALLAVEAAPSYSQNATFEEVLAGKTVPLTLALKDLNGDWRRFSLSGQADMGSFMRLVTGVGAANDVYYSKGQTVTIGTETYAIAYRAKIKGPDFMALMRGGPGNMPAVQEKLTPDTPLTLALLNQRTMGSLNDIRPFNLDQELAADVQEAAFGGPRVAALNQQSMSNLKQMGLGLVMFAQDNGEILPGLTDAASIKKNLMPYIKTDEVFVHPGTKAPYVVNPLISGKKMADFPAPAETITFAEAQVSPDGSLAVGYLDGHVKRLSPDEQKAVAGTLGRMGVALQAARVEEPQVAQPATVKK